MQEGKPLLQLGPKEIEIVPLDFSPDERKVSAPRVVQVLAPISNGFADLRSRRSSAKSQNDEILEGWNCDEEVRYRLSLFIAVADI
jgi:hypothetical protein